MTVTDSFALVCAEHFQPERVLLGSVQERAHVCDAALRPITLGEIDETRAFRAEDVYSKAQRFRLSIIVHCAKLTRGYPDVTDR